MRRLKLFILFIIFLFQFQISSEASSLSSKKKQKPKRDYISDNYFIYKVHRNDSLSNILNSYRLAPLYGENGMLNFIQKVNDTEVNNINLVFKNQKILIPKDLFEERYFVVTPKKHIPRKMASVIESSVDEPLPSSDKLSTDPQIEAQIDSQENKITPVVQPSIPVSAPVVTQPLPVQPLQVDHTIVIEKPVKTIPVVIETKKVNLPLVPVIENPSKVVLLVGSGFMRIDSTYTTTSTLARVLSDAEQNFDLKWNQHWNKKITTYLGIDYTQVAFRNSVLNQVKDANQKLFNFSWGAQYQVSSFLNIGLKIKSSQNLFLQSYSTGTVNLERQPITQTGATIDLKVIEKSPYKIDLNFNAFSLSKNQVSNYTISNGSLIETGFTLTQKFKNYKLLGKVLYKQAQQNTSVTTQTNKEIQYSVGFEY